MKKHPKLIPQKRARHQLARQLTSQPKHVTVRQVTTRQMLLATQPSRVDLCQDIQQAASQDINRSLLAAASCLLSRSSPCRSAGISPKISHTRNLA